MAILYRIRELFEEYDKLAACHFEDKEYVLDPDVLMMLREEKQELIQQATDEQVEAFEDDLRDCFTISELCEGYEYIDFTETARKLLQLGYYKIEG